MPTQQIKKYDSITRYMHWISAAIILWASFTGIYAVYLPPESNLKNWISFVNVSLTSLFIPLFMFRIYYRYFMVSMESEKIDIPGYHIAKLFHHFMYMSIFFVLVTGVLMMDVPINVFNWFVIPNIIQDKEVIHLFEVIHKISSQLLIVIVLLHIGAVVKHEFSNVSIIKRMV